MTFKLRPWQEPRAEQSPAQAAATARNFRIFRLRGLHAQMYLLTGPRRAMAQELVDMELAAMGADTMNDAARKAARKRLAKKAKRAKNPHEHVLGDPMCLCKDCMDDIPF